MGQNDPVAPVQIGQNSDIRPAAGLKDRFDLGTLLPADFNQNTAPWRQMILRLSC